MNMTFTKAVLLTSAIWSSVYAFNTQASELSIGYGLNTTHVTECSDCSEGFVYNEDNNLFSIEYTDGKHGVNISSFINSYYNQTFTVGASYNVFDSKYFEIAALYGVVKGYEEWQLKTVFMDDIGIYFAPRFTIKHDLSHNFKVKLSTQVFGTAIVTTCNLAYTF